MLSVGFNEKESQLFFFFFFLEWNVLKYKKKKAEKMNRKHAVRAARRRELVVWSQHATPAVKTDCKYELHSYRAEIPKASSALLSATQILLYASSFILCGIC